MSESDERVMRDATEALKQASAAIVVWAEPFRQMTEQLERDLARIDIKGFGTLFDLMGEGKKQEPPQ